MSYYNTRSAAVTARPAAHGIGTLLVVVALVLLGIWALSHIFWIFVGFVLGIAATISLGGLGRYWNEARRRL